MFKLLYTLFLSNLLNAAIPGDTVTTVIRNVNIVDVVKGEIIPNQTLVIKKGVIESVSKYTRQLFPKNTIIIEGQNKFLMPGLWDMHFHIAWKQTNDTALFPILLKYGITGIRDMGGDLSILNDLKKSVKKNFILGPDIIGAGPMVDGNPPVHKDFSLVLDSNSNTTYYLDSLVKNGIDFIKVYSLLKESELNPIAHYASKHKIPFVGHLSEYIEPEISLKLGQKSVEHLNRLEDIWLSDKKRMGTIADLMKMNNAWLCPTLSIYHMKVHMIDSFIINTRLERYIDSKLKREWEDARLQRMNRFSDSSKLKEQKKLFTKQKDLVAFLFKKKVKLLAGSDFAGMAFIYPGISLHKELELLVEAGIPISETIKAATINPALYLGIENKNGSVTPGKYADLILLDRNPLENIKHTQTILKVFKRGQLVE